MAVVPETHDITTFMFAAPAPRLFRFIPGQFLTFSFDIDGETVHRCYTVASSPTRPDLVSITVKRVPGGPVSNWLHDTLVPGAVVRATGPMGEFSSWLAGGPKFLYLAGGVGLTPLMSMSRAGHDLAVSRDVVFVNAVRSPADIAFRREFETMARARPGFRIVHLVEHLQPEPEWAGFQGRLSRPFLEHLVPDLKERDVFCCGPSPFMSAARQILGELGYDMARYREESFKFEELSTSERVASELAAAVVDSDSIAAPSFTVRFTKSNRELEVRADETVLAAARAAGMRLPSSCTKGLCGTCKSRKLEGEVDMRHGGGIRQREIDQGLVLLCCSKPRSDLVIER
jgi:ferredoxin-NADP reductase